MNATVAANKIAVKSIHTYGNRDFLTITVPNAWDDVKNLTNKVLTHDNKDYTFSGWNSDDNECYFVRIKNGPNFVATIR